MATTIRPEVSKKSKYWIERHRYYELKHFCLQYTGKQKKVKNTVEVAGPIIYISGAAALL